MKYFLAGLLFWTFRVASAQVMLPAYQGVFSKPVANANSIITSGLVLNLDAGNTASYPGSGTVWTDLSGNGYNGTLTNGPIYSSSNGGTIVFDGTNDVASFGNILNIGLSSWTMSCWVKFNYVSGLAGIMGKTSYRAYVGRYSFNLEGVIYWRFSNQIIITL
jgi:hypothetical protein